MRCSVSRSLQDAARDAEWPGQDPRRWRQTTLTKTGLRVPPARAEAPLSPSLRKAASVDTALLDVALPPVAPGQTRITSLVRSSSR